jgi:DNA helicase-2/ATP-dependent DNA helicase PcrA
MVKDFQPCRQIFLEQNYRSTGAILGAALAVVRQGKVKPRLEKTPSLSPYS